MARSGTAVFKLMNIFTEILMHVFADIVPQKRDTHYH